jgi:hypothetical protein
LYVGRIEQRPIALPICLTIHPSIVHLDNLLSKVIPELVTHLPNLVQDTALQRSQRNARTKPRLWRTSELEFNAQFRSTQPTYQIMTRQLNSSNHSNDDSEEDNDSDMSSSDMEQEDDFYNDKTNIYKGGDYRAFIVSAHSLHVRVIARNEPKLVGTNLPISM